MPAAEIKEKQKKKKRKKEVGVGGGGGGGVGVGVGGGMWADPATNTVIVSSTIIVSCGLVEK